MTQDMLDVGTSTIPGIPHTDFDSSLNAPERTVESIKNQFLEDVYEAAKNKAITRNDGPNGFIERPMIETDDGKRLWENAKTALADTFVKTLESGMEKYGTNLADYAPGTDGYQAAVDAAANTVTKRVLFGFEPSFQLETALNPGTSAFDQSVDASARPARSWAETYLLEKSQGSKTHVPAP